MHEHHHSSVESSETILTVRANSGLSGDMMVTGLALMSQDTLEDAQARIGSLVESIGVSALEGGFQVERCFVRQIAGWRGLVSLPHEHAHRTLKDILHIIEQSTLTPGARTLASSTFTLLAEAEGRVHGHSPEDVHFHEVGALDSILDICLACALFDAINPALFVCSPLPLAEGGVQCAHGWLPTPAPAVLELLKDVPVQGFAGRGESLTPTAIALLKSLGAVFGPWPTMHIRRRALVYGTTVFDDAPNGAIWAYGPAFKVE